jgi:Protein of unknown function (DUF1579)
MTNETQQATPTFAEPQDEHRWLQKLVGEWTSEFEAEMPSAPPTTFKGSEVFRSLGDLWVLGEAEGESPGGGTDRSIITLGYDPEKQKFVGTFVGSTMTHLWIYEGTLDAAKKILTLEAEGPDMSEEGRMTKYQDIHEFESDDHRLFRTQMLDSDGKWHQFMTGHYRRR